MLDDFTQTPERAAIIERLEKAQAELEQAAALLAADLVARGRGREIQNLTQQVASQKSLIAQDWSLADGARAA